jgi:hypothetical protein
MNIIVGLIEKIFISSSGFWFFTIVSSSFSKFAPHFVQRRALSEFLVPHAWQNIFTFPQDQSFLSLTTKLTCRYQD